MFKGIHPLRTNISIENQLVEQTLHFSYDHNNDSRINCINFIIHMAQYIKHYHKFPI